MNINARYRQLQLAFKTAFVLHPLDTVAFRVVWEALDVIPFIMQSLARRKRSIRHYKSPIPPGAELLFAVFTASHRRELDQESPRPLMEPKYKPTRDDLIVRYIKHLIWKTILFNNSGYLGAGLGCWLYGYTAKQISHLAVLGSDDLRAVKMRVARQIKKRFRFSEIVNQGNTIRRAPATAYDRLLIMDALKAFVPWGSHHTLIPSDLSLHEVLCSDTVSEWDLKHALIDPDCGGLERLIIELNEYFGRYREHLPLPDPAEMLFVPAFDGSPTPPQDRFRCRELTETELMALNERRELSRDWAAEVEEMLDELEESFGEDCACNADPQPNGIEVGRFRLLLLSAIPSNMAMDYSEEVDDENQETVFHPLMPPVFPAIMPSMSREQPGAVWKDHVGLFDADEYWHQVLRSSAHWEPQQEEGPGLLIHRLKVDDEKQRTAFYLFEPSMPQAAPCAPWEIFPVGESDFRVLFDPPSRWKVERAGWKSLSHPIELLMPPERPVWEDPFVSFDGRENWHQVLRSEIQWELRQEEGPGLLIHRLKVDDETQGTVFHLFGASMPQAGPFVGELYQRLCYPLNQWRPQHAGWEPLFHLVEQVMPEDLCNPWNWFLPAYLSYPSQFCCQYLWGMADGGRPQYEVWLDLSLPRLLIRFRNQIPGTRLISRHWKRETLMMIKTITYAPRWGSTQFLVEGMCRSDYYEREYAREILDLKLELDKENREQPSRIEPWLIPKQSSDATCLIW